MLNEPKKGKDAERRHHEKRRMCLVSEPQEEAQLAGKIVRTGSQLLKQYVLKQMFCFPVGTKKFDFLLIEAKQLFSYMFQTGSLSPSGIPRCVSSTTAVSASHPMIPVSKYLAKYAASNDKIRTSFVKLRTVDATSNISDDTKLCGEMVAVGNNGGNMSSFF